MKKVMKFLDEHLEEVLCVFLMSFMTLLIFVQVVMRYVFNNSLSWSEELARYVFIWLVYIGVSYGCKLQKHLRIDAALYIFPEKIRPYIRIIGDVLFLFFAFYIVYTGFNYSLEQTKFHVHSTALKIPMEYIYFSAVIGYGLAAFRQIQAIIQHIKGIQNRKQVKEVIES